MRLAIGDIHGRDFWKRYLDEDYGEFYFTGDYFDSFNVPFRKQLENFREICAAALQDPRIKLCLGNHDYHYMRGVEDQRYSGYQSRNRKIIEEILEKNMGLLKVLYVTEDKYIISHAGVSNTFLGKLKKKGETDIAGVNEAFLKDRNILAFDGYDIYGDDLTQSPIWIRPNSLYADAVSGYSQIVGHTQLAEISEVPLDSKQGAEAKLVFIDTGDIDTIYRF